MMSSSGQRDQPINRQLRESVSDHALGVASRVALCFEEWAGWTSRERRRREIPNDSRWRANLKHRALGSQGVAPMKIRVTRLAELGEFL